MASFDLAISSQLFTNSEEMQLSHDINIFTAEKKKLRWNGNIPAPDPSKQGQHDKKILKLINITDIGTQWKRKNASKDARTWL